MEEPDDDDDESPLMAAIRERQTLDDIKAIVEADPSLVRKRSGREGYSFRCRLPLHRAIELGLPTDIVRYLLEQWPESIRERTTDTSIYRRYLPVHIACEQCNIDGDDDMMSTVLLLLTAWPESIRERNGDGDLPVHLATPLELIKHLLKAWPQSVQEPGCSGAFLLHLAVARSAPLPTVQFVVKTWPASVRATDEDGGTALHWITGELSPDVIDYLLEQGGEEDLLLLPDNDGNPPLHCLLESDFGSDIDEATVRYLIRRSPQSVQVRSGNGSLPLHLAMKKDVPPTLVRFLVNAWPQAVRETTTDDDGFLPLHVAAEAAQFEHMEYLLEQYPESVQVQATDGSLAVHVLLRHEPDDRFDVDLNRSFLQMARELVERYPRSVHVATNDGLLPLHVALEMGYGRRPDEDNEGGGGDEEEDDVEVEFIRYLVGLGPTTVRVASDEFLFPFDYAIRSFYTSIPTVRFLATQWPDVVGHVDSDGRTKLHVVSTQYPPRPNMVRLVAELRPQLHEARDRTGATPLHVSAATLPAREDLLCRRDSGGHVQRALVNSLQVLRYLANQRPQSLSERDHHRDDLPVHAALARDVPSTGVVKLLVELRPESLGVANRNGSLPLHVAVANCRSHVPRRRLGSTDAEEDVVVGRPTPAVDLVKFLVEQRPDSVRVKDSNGNVPLVVAASSDADMSVLFYLSTTWPEAIYGAGRCRDSSAQCPPPFTSRPNKRVKMS